MDAVMSTIESVVQIVNKVLWDYALIFLLVGTGIFFTFRLGFVQIRKFGSGLKKMFGNFSLHGKDHKDGLSSFQALTTAIAAQVGTGNIAGAATALASGGPGAIFWMWVSAFFGMATIYAEAILAQKTRQTKDGQLVGGPVYYIRYIFKGKFGRFLAGFFSVAIILALGFMGNMVQSNSIGVSFANAFHVKPWIVGICVAGCSSCYLPGRRTENCPGDRENCSDYGGILHDWLSDHPVYEWKRCGAGFSRHLSVGAFNPQAVMGGALGVGVQQAMRYGVARGLFSNEAGMGSTPHAHAIAKVDHPADQGVIAMMGVFIDTFIILTLTALVILSTGVLGNGLTGSELAQSAFDSAFGSFENIYCNLYVIFCLYHNYWVVFLRRGKCQGSVWKKSGESVFLFWLSCLFCWDLRFM